MSGTGVAKENCCETSRCRHPPKYVDHARLAPGPRQGAAALACDSVVVDLEDGVAPAAKQQAREAIDAAYFLDPKDPVATRADAQLASEQGFDGKLLFHPAQIAVANEVFAPNAEEISHAQRLVDGFESAQAEGQGTVVVDGAFLALYTVIPLRRTIWLARRLEL